MSSESTSSRTPRCLLTPSSKVKFQHHESNIAYNNSIALLVHHEQPLLSFLSNCSICTALTKEPSAIKSAMPLPLKGTVRAGLATLGLADKDKPSLTSTEHVNSSPLKLKYFSPIWKIFMQYIVKCLGGMQGSHDQMNFSQQTIAYCLIFGLEINIGDIIFKELINKIQNGKKNRETNVCYTRYISLVLEQLFGENYHDESLTLLKPHHISIASFQTPSTSEVSLTSHMLKVAKFSKEPDESLILPFGEVNAEATADKEMNPPSTTTHIQETKELVVIDVPTQSLEASVMAKVQDKQLKAANTIEVLEKIIEKEEVAEEQTLEIPTGVQLLDEVNKAAQETPQSPYDTES
ncbi:hypothetical protein Tco_0319689 [Tanacetum coccineum]